MNLVSAITVLTLSRLIPNSSVAIWLIDDLDPPISGFPSTTPTVPSKFMFKLTQVFPPKLNQKPHEIPLP